MNCPKCGEVCHCLTEPPPNSLPIGSPAETAEPALAGTDAAPADEPNSAWRGELAARLSRYRARRKAPPPRYPSLKLPFETTASSPRASMDESSRFPAFESVSNNALALDVPRNESVIEAVAAEAGREPVPRTATPVRQPVTQVSAKIIEFPRFAWAPPSPPPDQLAEPVSDKPRILEVPETAPSPPALGGISIEPAQIQEIEKRPESTFRCRARRWAGVSLRAFLTPCLWLSPLLCSDLYSGRSRQFVRRNCSSTRWLEASCAPSGFFTSTC